MTTIVNNNKITPTPIVLSDTATTMSDATNNLFETSPLGSITSAIGNSIYGINHRQTPGAIQINKDFYGLTFFTRPQLNLSTGNLQTIRQFAPLLSTSPNSLQRIIRSLLDPRLAKDPDSPVTCALVDDRQAFIPMLTNHLLSISGWPDVTAPTMTSQEGVYKEVFSMVDGITANYSTYNIQANFRNIPGDPITLLFLIWCHYAANVYEGTMVPYPDKIIQNEIDYNTRIYRLVLDGSKTYVKKIGACGAAFPTSSPIGAAFNFEHDRPINSSNDQISINFTAMGAMYQDDILISEFNATGEYFNGTLSSVSDIENKIAAINPNCFNDEGYRKAIKAASKGQYYTKVSSDELAIFNNKGYPHINMNTYELGWFVPNELYAQMMPAVTP